MPKVERFEDLDAWKDARALSRLIHGFVADGKWSRRSALGQQITRAAISVMSNIAEGFERRSDAEFHRFLAIAKGSAAEVRSQLYAALDCCFVEPAGFKEAYGLVDRTSRRIGGLMNYLKRRPRKDSEGSGSDRQSPTHDP